MADPTPPSLHPGSNGSNAVVVDGRLPPPAPPLPPLPQRYGQRAATAFAKLAHPWLTSHPTRSGSSHGTPDQTVPAREEPLSRPSGSRYASKVQRSSRTGIPIAALDISPSKSHAVLAGREILKTVRLDTGSSATEDVNIRSNIINYASAHSSSRVAVSARHREQLAANDVRWSNGVYESIIATAAASGRIVLYDLNRPALELTKFIEHTRQVHKLAFNSFEGKLLLSGSQDGGIKLWDIRSATSSRRSQATFNAHDQGIRDVRWSTKDGVEFATGTEGGVVQRWDIRRPTAPIVKVKAHDNACHAIDYHPSGNYLVSGGADAWVKVWDTTKTDKRQKPGWNIRVPDNVLNVRWRPHSNVRNSDGEIVSEPSSCLATTYHRDPRLHVWDFHRPHVPLLEVDRYDSPASDMLWHSDGLIWTVGGAGMFTQTDLNFVPQPAHTLRTNRLAVSTDSSITMFSDSQSSSNPSMPVFPDTFLPRSDTGGSSGERFGSSVSANEGSMEDGSLLTSTLRRRRKKAAASRALVGVPRTGDDAAFGRAERALSLAATFSTSQLGAHGSLQGISNASSFQRLAEQYASPADTSTFSSFESAAKQFEMLFMTNSAHAVRAGDSGLAHTWNILAWAVKKELEDWSENPDADRARQELHRRSQEIHDVNAQSMLRTASASTAREHVHALPLLANSMHESSSNVPTPRVKPSSGASNVPVLPPGSLGDSHAPNSDDTLEQISLSDLSRSDDSGQGPPVKDEPHILVQSPSLSPRLEGLKDSGQMEMVQNEPRGRSPPEPAEEGDEVQSLSDFEEQLAAKRAALSDYRQTPRPVLRLGNTLDGFGSTPQSPSRALHIARPGLDRFDSGESFNLLSESLDSHVASLPMSSFEESPLKRRKGSPELSAEPIRQDIEDRLLLSELGKQAAAEENGRLLEELSGSVAPSVAPADPAALVETKKPDIRPEDQSASLPQAAIVYMDEADPVASSTPEAEPEPMDSGGETAESVRYFKHAVDLDYASVKPWHASSFLPALVNHHLDSLSTAQLPVFLALYLHPIYPTIFPTRKSLSVNIRGADDVSARLVKSRANLTASRLAAVLLTYHKQLATLQHYTAAARFRKDCANAFPEIALRANPGKVPGYWCRNCQKPSKGKNNGHCTRCKRDWGGCMVCGELRLAPKRRRMIQNNAVASKSAAAEPGAVEDVDGGPKSGKASVANRPKGISGISAHGTQASGSNLAMLASSPQSRSESRKRSSRGGRWSYCSFCAHGGHASCLSAWFGSAVSRGACAMSGCDHACGPGPARDEFRAARAKERAEAQQLRRGAGVLKDDRVALESKAVREARDNDAPGSMPVVARADTKDAGLMTLPMESVRQDSFLDAHMGLGLGRGRGRWRTSATGTAGATGLATAGESGGSSRSGRHSLGGVAGVPLASDATGNFLMGEAGDAASSADGSTTGSSMGMQTGSAILSAASGSGGPRRVTILGPRKDMDDELVLDFGVEGSTSSSVP